MLFLLVNIIIIIVIITNTWYQ